MKFKIGDKVNKSKGYSFPGIVVAAFTTTLEAKRYVVEFFDEDSLQSRGMLHIFKEKQLILQEET